MKVVDVLDFLAKQFPLSDAEEWDMPGMHVGDFKAEVTGIATALDPTPAVIKQAAEAGCNLLVTHHPAYISTPSDFAPDCTQASIAGTSVWQAARLGVSIIAMHTNLDVSDAALNQAATKLGLKRLSRLCEPQSFGVILDAHGMELDELAKRAASAYECSPTVWGESTLKLDKVAFSSGSFSSLVRPAIEAGVSAVICGECGYHALLELDEAGVGAILLGHDASELPYAQLLADTLRSFAPADIAITVLSEPLRWHVLTEEN